MIHRPKFLAPRLTGFFRAKQSVRLFETKARIRRHYARKKEDEDGEKHFKAKEGLEEYIHLQKSRGQHILTNPRVLDAIVRNAEVRPTDTILEIGPGTGNLTLRLLEASNRVIAIEIDKRMIEILSNRVAERGLEDKLTVLCKDALKTEFPEFDLVVANIPYGISSPLIAKIVFGTKSFRSATLLVQKEFARRLLAKPGDSEFNRLAVNVKLVAEMRFIMDVSKKGFVPSPVVDSSLVKIWPKIVVPSVDMEEWWGFTRTCFSKKNKTLGAIFRQKKKVLELLRISRAMDSHSHEAATGCSCDGSNEGDEYEEQEEDEGGRYSSSDVEMTMFREKIIGILKANGFEERRPSKLSNEDFLRLLSLFNKAGIRFNEQANKIIIESTEAYAASY